MSEGIGDFLDGQFAAQDAAGAPPAAPEAPAAPAAPAAPEAPVDLDGALEGDKFDRAYVERLRKEAASYRSKAKTYGDVFDQYEEADREAFLSLAKTLREDPKSAAQEMAAAAEAILKQYETGQPQGVDADGEPQYLTMADYQRLQEEQAVAAEMKNIEVEARELGYTIDQKDVDYRLLLITAQNETGGDIAAAHAKIEARNQAIVDKYLAAKAADAEGSPRVPAGDAQIPGTAQPIKSFKDARAGLEAFIAQQRTGM
jgi:hypothetical protein